MLIEVGNPYDRAARDQFDRVCQTLGLVPIRVEISAAGGIDRAIAQLVSRRAQALVLGDFAFVRDHRFEIVDAATKHGLPTMAGYPDMAREAGALISYRASQAEVFRRRAEHIDRILRGAKPADLPVKQPTQFELVINLKTARALGLTIPKDLLLRADEVIR